MYTANVYSDSVFLEKHASVSIGTLIIYRIRLLYDNCSSRIPSMNDRPADIHRLVATGGTHPLPPLEPTSHEFSFLETDKVNRGNPRIMNVYVFFAISNVTYGAEVNWPPGSQSYTLSTVR